MSKEDIMFSVFSMISIGLIGLLVLLVLYSWGAKSIYSNPINRKRMSLLVGVLGFFLGLIVCEFFYFVEFKTVSIGGIVVLILINIVVGIVFGAQLFTAMLAQSEADKLLEKNLKKTQQEKTSK